jgi:uncharacterized protein (DUF58 family)
MKSLAMKILKVFLVLLLIALVLLLISGLVLMIGWPLWVGIFFIIGLAGLLLGLLFVKKLMARKVNSDSSKRSSPRMTRISKACHPERRPDPGNCRTAGKRPSIP